MKKAVKNVRNRSGALKTATKIRKTPDLSALNIGCGIHKSFVGVVTLMILLDDIQLIQQFVPACSVKSYFCGVSDENVGADARIRICLVAGWRAFLIVSSSLYFRHPLSRVHRYSMHL